MKLSLLSAAILLLSGAVIGYNFITPDTDSAVKVAETQIRVESVPTQINADEHLQGLMKRIDALEMTLNSEKNERELLTQQLVEIKHTLSKISSVTNPENADISKPAVVSEQATQTSTETNVINSPRSADTRREILQAQGISQSKIDTIQQKIEKQEMETLYLRNTAIREGWFGTEKYFEQSRKINDEGDIFREELGDDKYDVYLYEMEQPNRIVITDIINGSPAEQIGLQAGDIIYRYDDERIFSWSDLTTLTAEGEAGKSVALQIIRDNTPIEMYIARGPIGVRLNAVRVNPNS